MNRWHITILLSAALTLCAFECQMSIPGESLPRTPETEALHAAVDDVAWAWAADPALPSIDTPRCDVALYEIDLRTATEREWIDELRLCPMMAHGCSRAPGCTGGVRHRGGVPHGRRMARVPLARGERRRPRRHRASRGRPRAQLVHRARAGLLALAR